MNKKALKGYIYVILSAVIFGCMPLMSKIIYKGGVNPLTLVLLRNLFALPTLAVLSFLQSKKLSAPKKALPFMTLLAFLGCCATPVLLFSSYQFISSGTATVFHFIYPALVILFGIVFFKRKPDFINIVSVVICFLGIVMFYNPSEPLNLKGSLLALMSGVTFAFYTILLPRFNHNVSSFLFSFFIAAISSIIMLIICLVTNQLCLPSTLEGWLLCILFAFLVTTCAVVLFQQGTFIIGSERASILSTLEPITGVFIGVIIFNEYIGPKTVLGTILVVTASVIASLFKDKTKLSGKKV